MRRILYFSLFLSILLLASPYNAWGQTRIKIGIVSTTFGHAPFFVAKEKGFYKREGLDAEVIVMNRDELILQALVSDSIQFGSITPALVLAARDKGLTGIKMIAGSL